MTIDIAVTVGGSVALAIISALIGASMDTRGQRRSAGNLAMKRQELEAERMRLQRERRRLEEERRLGRAPDPPHADARCPRCGRRL